MERAFNANVAARSRCRMRPEIFYLESDMNVLTDSVKKIYSKYLLFSLGSAIIVSIYSTVDAIVIGQYEGAAGSAALSCIMPMWSMFMSLSILIGIGGSILMSTSRGSGNERRSDEFFTASMI